MVKYDQCRGASIKEKDHLDGYLTTCIADQTSYIPPPATNLPPQVGQLQLMRPDEDDDNNHIFGFPYM